MSTFDPLKAAREELNGLNDPMPRMPTNSRYGSENVGTLETIQQEWLRSIQEFERRFDEHRKRLEAHSANTRSVIDEMKRLGG